MRLSIAILIACASFAAVVNGGPNVARYAATRGSTTPADTGWDDALTNVMVLRYWMDPTSTNAIGKLNDSSPAANHGTIAGAVWTITGTNGVSGGVNNGRVEHAYSFDSTDDGVKTTSVVPINGMNYSIAVWFLNTGAGDYDTIYNSWDVGVGNHQIWLFLMATGQIKLETYENASSVMSSPATGYDDGVWHHCAVTLSGTTATMYVDGLPVVTNAAALVVTGTTETHVGERFTGGTFSFTGMIDDVRVYSNTVLTTTQVSNLWYNTRKGDNSNENGY